MELYPKKSRTSDEINSPERNTNKTALFSAITIQNNVQNRSNRENNGKNITEPSTALPLARTQA